MKQKWYSISIKSPASRMSLVFVEFASPKSLLEIFSGYAKTSDIHSANSGWITDVQVEELTKNGQKTPCPEISAKLKETFKKIFIQQGL